ncbi:MAG: energy-coupling factor ABC transporter ATP-binding protein [Sporomusa sp.]
MPVIQITNFSYAYQQSHKALDNINLTVEKGSFTALLGSSGAGKTTLCLALAGAVPHYFGGSLAGSVRIDQVLTTDTTMPALSQTVGSVLQDYEIQLVTMTVEEEIAFTLENLGLPEETIIKRITETLDTIGLRGYEKVEIAALSGGQKQRLAIGSVLAANPSILVLDEPSSALDPEGTQELYKLLGELNRTRSLTIVVVEHDIASVLPYADQFVLLQNGKLLQAGSPAEVLSAMWSQQITPDALPPLWQLKLMLEEQTGLSFSAWRTEQDAIEELSGCLLREDFTNA